MAQLPCGVCFISLGTCMFSFWVSPKLNLILYYLSFIFFLFIEWFRSTALAPQLTLLILTRSGNPDLIKKWPWGETQDGHLLKMPVQTLSCINKQGKTTVSYGNLFKQSQSPLHTRWPAGHLPSTSPGCRLTLSFHFYDFASVTSKPETLNDV